MEVISISAAIAALGAACVAVFWAGRVDGRLNNGLTQNIQGIHENIGKIFDQINNLPCAVHEERIKHVEHAAEQLNK